MSNGRQHKPVNDPIDDSSWVRAPRTVRAFLAASHDNLSLELLAAALAGYAASASTGLADRLADIDTDRFDTDRFDHHRFDTDRFDTDRFDTDRDRAVWRAGVQTDPVIRVPAPRPPRSTM